MIKRGKKGELLVENIVFIILNLVFLSILVLFLVNQGSSSSLIEDAYSKQIALLVDSAKPGMIIRLNMQKAFDVASENGIDFSDAVKITGNTVVVALDSGTGRSYEFFNDVSGAAYPDVNSKNEYNGIYVITVSRAPSKKIIVEVEDEIVEQ